MRTFSSGSTTALTICSVIAMARAAGFPPPSLSGPTKVSQSVSGATMHGTSGGIRVFDFASGSASSGSTGTSVKAFQDTLYMVDVSLGGQTFSLQMDTGSSDLWVYPGNSKIQITNTTDLQITESYGKGSASGTIQFAELDFSGFTVPYQAFLLADTINDFSFVDAGLASGILGLAFEDDGGSPINAAIQAALEDPASTLGATPIFNILISNPNLPNSFDIALDRTSDLNDTAIGTLLIGAHAAGYESITSQPQLPRVFQGRWTVPTDGMSVNGQPFHFAPSSIDGLKPGQIGVVLDTGFSLPPLPPAAVDAIYSSISGAVFIQKDFPQWLVPCKGVTNLTFTLGGKDIPIHPLDLTAMSTTVITDSNGQDSNVTFCYNTYQYLDLDPTSFAGFDAILGDAFLRNVYASFDYGTTTTQDAQGAFVQLLPTTDLNNAIPEFIAARNQVLASMPPEISPQDLLNLIVGSGSGSAGSDAGSGSGSGSGTPTGTGPASGSSPAATGSTRPAIAGSSVDGGSDSSSQLYDLVKKYGPIIIGLLAGNVIIGLLLLIVGLVVCFKSVLKSGAKARSIKSTYAPVRFKDAEAAEDSSRYAD